MFHSKALVRIRITKRHIDFTAVPRPMPFGQGQATISVCDTLLHYILYNMRIVRHEVICKNMQ